METIFEIKCEVCRKVVGQISFSADVFIDTTIVTAKDLGVDKAYCDDHKQSPE